MNDREPTTIAVAFDAFYRREFDGQVRRAWLMLGDEQLAIDAVSTAFVRVYERWNSLESPGPYLNRTVLNGCRDAARRRARRRRLIERIRPVEATVDQPDELCELLLRLPFRQRAVVVLRHYVGMTEAEISAALDIPAGSVGPTLHRAHARLREVLS